MKRSVKRIHVKREKSVNVRTLVYKMQVRLKADLHGTILSHATSLQHAYDTKKSRRILKHVLKPYDKRGLKSVVSVS